MPFDGFITSNDHLRNAVTGLYAVGFAAEIQQNDFDFAAVAGINGGWSIRQRNRVTERQTAARANLCFKAWRELDGQTSGNKGWNIGNQLDGLDGTQIHAGVFGGAMGIARQLRRRMKALNLDLHTGELFSVYHGPPRYTEDKLPPMLMLQNQFERNFITTSVDYVFNWARKSALWPLTFGLACCAIEMIASTTSRFDIARFGAEVFRPSPRQSDLMIVAGTVTLKMAPVLKRIYDQMPEPKWVISMGACSSVGGPFNTYAVLQGVDKIVPVDVYVTGCPPRPENLFYALLKLQEKIDRMTTLVKRPTEVRLTEAMLEDFKRQIMIAQVQQPLVQLDELVRV